jgi:hypothetical protein
MADIFKVNDEGVRALRDLSQVLPEQIGIIRTAGVAVIECQNSNASGLGPHSASISSVLEDVNQEAVQATAPIQELKEKVDKVADAYQAIIDNDRYGK